MAVVVVGSDQPFKSRQGVDTVLTLRFDYDPDVVELVKDALAEARRLTGLFPAGGWLADRRYWFCEHWAWPTVRRRLEQAGHAVNGPAASCRRPDPTPRPPANPATRKLAAVLEEWAWTMKTRWSDDARPVIEASHELLREMLLEQDAAR
jgi:hypothetical protein